MLGILIRLVSVELDFKDPAKIRLGDSVCTRVIHLGHYHNLKQLLNILQQGETLEATWYLLVMACVDNS